MAPRCEQDIVNNPQVSGLSEGEGNNDSPRRLLEQPPRRPRRQAFLQADSQFNNSQGQSPVSGRRKRNQSLSQCSRQLSEPPLQRTPLGQVEEPSSSNCPPSSLARLRPLSFSYSPATAASQDNVTFANTPETELDASRMRGSRRKPIAFKEAVKLPHRAHATPVDSAYGSSPSEKEIPIFDEEAADAARKSMLGQARAVANVIAQEKASAAMPPPSLPERPVNIPFARAIKELIINDKLQEMHSKAKIHKLDNQQRHGWYTDGLPLKGMTFFDGFKQIWFIPYTIPTPGVPASRDYKATTSDVIEIMEDRRYDPEVSIAYRLIEKEMWDAHSIVEWEAMRRNGSRAVTWGDVRNEVSMNEMVGIVCKNRLLSCQACLPGYHTINLVVFQQGRLVASPEYIPPNVGFSVFIAKMETWDPADGSRVDILLNTIRVKIDELKKIGHAYGKRKAAEFEGELKGPRFALNEVGSERRRWKYKFWNGPKFQMPPNMIASDEGWTFIEGHSDLDKIKAMASQKKLPVFVRPWELRARQMWYSLEEMIEESKKGMVEPEFSPEQLELLDQLIGEQPREVREQNRLFGQMLKQQREFGGGW